MFDTWRDAQEYLVVQGLVAAEGLGDDDEATLTDHGMQVIFAVIGLLADGQDKTLGMLAIALATRMQQIVGDAYDADLLKFVQR